MASNHYHVLIDPLADRKLAAHIEFLARVSETAAIKLYKDYEEALVFIGSSPLSCPLYMTLIQTDAEFRYKLFGKRYRIVFEIVSNMVYVYDIQDYRQDTDKNLL
jgi:hypothetical protein